MLILDNCEHLLDACATLVDAILRSAPEPTIIATSREPLHVEGEQTYTLQSLSLPEPPTDAEAVGRSEAVQLFIERVQRQLPDFALTAARAPAVAQLCVHLDGIPLALELAAARIRSLSIEQINARLNDRFKLLTGGTRTALLRQQTLRATFDWSFDLLAEQERAVLRRIAVFAGGLTLEAASFVASDEAIDEFGVIDLLSQLVARSLVVADTSDAGARYRLLETTRAYALEKLAEGGSDPVPFMSCAVLPQSVPSAPGLAADVEAGWRALAPPGATTSVLRSTGRSVLMATRRSASRSRVPRDRCGRNRRSSARVGSDSRPPLHGLERRHRTRIRRGCGSGEGCWGESQRRPKGWQQSSEPSICIVGWATG